MIQMFFILDRCTNVYDITFKPVRKSKTKQETQNSKISTLSENSVFLQHPISAKLT